jgi:hypothetical protein
MEHGTSPPIVSTPCVWWSGEREKPILFEVGTVGDGDFLTHVYTGGMASTALEEKS